MLRAMNHVGSQTPIGSSRRGRLLVAGRHIPRALIVARPEGSASPVAALTSDSWSYGVEKWFNPGIPMPSAVHTIRALMAWYTVIDRANPPSTVTQLSIERTALSSFTAQYGSPDCLSPELQVNLSHATYEQALGFVNVSRAGMVGENGTTVRAFALLNASGTASAVAVSSSVIWVFSPQGAKHVTEEFSASRQADASLAFDPALGLVPRALGVRDTRNGTSTYAGAGNWSVAGSYQKTNARGPTATLSGVPAVDVAAGPLAPAAATEAASCPNTTQNLCPAQGPTRVAPDTT